MFLVELTFNDKRNNVVISKSVGNDDICNASFENNAVNMMINARLIFNIINTSKNTVGIGTIRNTIGTNTYNPRNISVFFI